MFDSLVAELQFEIDRHNLRVTVAQTRKKQYERVFHLNRAGICIMCLEEVDHDIVLEELGHIFTQADRHGVESLTEHEQVVQEGKICTVHCLFTMIRSEETYFSELKEAQASANIEANGDTTFYGGPEGGE